MMINVAPIAARRLSVIHGQKMYSKFCKFFSSRFPLAFVPSLRKIMDSLTANFSFSLVHALDLSRLNMAVRAYQHLKAKVIIFEIIN